MSQKSRLPADLAPSGDGRFCVASRHPTYEFRTAARTARPHASENPISGCVEGSLVEDPEQRASEYRMIRIFNLEWKLDGDVLLY